MGLKPGFTNNRNGRPKGRPNRVSTDARQFINKFVEKNRRRMQKDFDQLDPFQRVQVMRDLFRYVAPQMSSVESNVTIESLTDGQMDDLFQRIIKSSGKHKA